MFLLLRWFYTCTFGAHVFLLSWSAWSGLSPGLSSVSSDMKWQVPGGMMNVIEIFVTGYSCLHKHGAAFSSGRWDGVFMCSYTREGTCEIGRACHWRGFQTMTPPLPLPLHLLHNMFEMLTNCAKLLTVFLT